MSNIIEFARERISQSPLTTDPWDYLYVENFLPEEFYDELSKETMSLLNHDELKKNEKTKVSLYDTRKSDEDQSMKNNVEKVCRGGDLGVNWLGSTRPDHALDVLPRASEFFKIFNDKVFRDLLSVKFKNSGRCGTVPQPKLTCTYAAYDVHTPGYTYKIHCDSGKKILSIIFYLAAKGDDESLGTRIYPGHIVPGDLDYDKDCVKILPYKPNSIFFFSRTNEKWKDDDGVERMKISNHAVQHKSTKTYLRRTIQLCFMDRLNGEERRKIYKHKLGYREVGQKQKNGLSSMTGD